MTLAPKKPGATEAAAAVSLLRKVVITRCPNAALTTLLNRALDIIGELA